MDGVIDGISTYAININIFIFGKGRHCDCWIYVIIYFTLGSILSLNNP
jgi:hypothetical protein